MRFKTASAVILAATAAAAADPVDLRVTVQSHVPSTSTAFAPLRVGVHSGLYDSFNSGQAASQAIISIAENGSGSDWFPAFAAADPGATLGTVGAAPLMPGETATVVLSVDPAVNRYFSFGSMVVPSNDFFIGNDSPTQYSLFDAGGNLAITSISQFGRDIWDAGSEVNGAFGAAFIQGSNNSDHIAENGVVHLNLQGLDIFNGLTTAAGYTFNRGFGADDEIYRISFEVVPAPGAAALLGLAGLAAARRRR